MFEASCCDLCPTVGHPVIIGHRFNMVTQSSPVYPTIQCQADFIYVLFKTLTLLHDHQIDISHTFLISASRQFSKIAQCRQGQPRWYVGMVQWQISEYSSFHRNGRSVLYYWLFTVLLRMASHNGRGDLITNRLSPIKFNHYSILGFNTPRL